jgi:hypothetical protein
MKHLRKFNESSVEDIKSNLEDIFIDFSDRHIPVEVTHRIIPCQFFSIALGDDIFGLERMISIVPKDNKDEFLRVYDYMESEGYDFSSMSYDSSGDIVTLRIVDIGLGIDSFSNHLFNGIDETCYLKLFFRKK